MYQTGHTLRKDRDLGLKQRLTNKPWKHSGYEVTIIPFLYKNAKCTWWEKSELQAGGISLQCVLWPMAGAQAAVINDSPGHYWTQRQWGRESHVDMRWRFGNKNPIRNDSPILDSVKNEFIFLNISGLVAEFVFLSPSLFFFFWNILHLLEILMPVSYHVIRNEDERRGLQAFL